MHDNFDNDKVRNFNFLSDKEMMPKTPTRNPSCPLPPKQRLDEGDYVQVLNIHFHTNI